MFFDFGKGRFHVVDDNVEGDVTVIALRRFADSAVDSTLEAGNRLDNTILDFVVGDRGGNVPTEDVGIEAAQALARPSP